MTDASVINSQHSPFSNIILPIQILYRLLNLLSHYHMMWLLWKTNTPGIHSHSLSFIPIPMPLFPFPFPYESYGTRGIAVVPNLMLISRNEYGHDVNTPVEWLATTHANRTMWGKRSVDLFSIGRKQSGS